MEKKDLFKTLFNSLNPIAKFNYVYKNDNKDIFIEDDLERIRADAYLYHVYLSEEIDDIQGLRSKYQLTESQALKYEHEMLSDLKKNHKYLDVVFFMKILNYEDQIVEKETLSLFQDSMKKKDYNLAFSLACTKLEKSKAKLALDELIVDSIKKDDYKHVIQVINDYMSIYKEVHGFIPDLSNDLFEEIDEGIFYQNESLEQRLKSKKTKVNEEIVINQIADLFAMEKIEEIESSIDKLGNVLDGKYVIAIQEMYNSLKAFKDDIN
ncbi:MAG: hypothetical protein PHT94_04155 [Candidatus Nanoarchaeia archaeon]|nr:hypothetical protein [Candidatus Nanoarchaeia archaeon]